MCIRDRINSVDDHLIEVVTDEGSIYLEENTSACSYVLFLVIDNAAAVADLAFVNKQNVENRFGFLTLQDKKLVFENHVLMPYENEFLFKIYFRLFKGEADKINANLKEIIGAHKTIQKEHQQLEKMLVNTKTWRALEPQHWYGFQYNERIAEGSTGFPRCRSLR